MLTTCSVSYTEYTHIQYTYEATTMRQRTTLISIQRKLTSPTRVFMKYMYKFTLNLRNFAQVQIHEKCFKFTIYVSSTEIIANITLNMNYNDIILSSKILEAIYTNIKYQQYYQYYLLPSQNLKG